MTGIAIAFVFGLAIALAIALALLQQRQRAEFIREATLPAGLLDALANTYPKLALKDRQLIARGLRKFFLARLKAGREPVAMPSKSVGELWRLFCAHPAAYRRFCDRAFGRHLPWSPAVGLGAERETNAALRRCWWHACREETISPRRPTRLPLLFALDAKLRIADGYHYFPDDFTRRRKLAQVDRSDGDGFEWSWDRERTWTAEDFQDTAFDGTTDGLGDSGSGDGGGGDGGGGD